MSDSKHLHKFFTNDQIEQRKKQLQEQQPPTKRKREDTPQHLKDLNDLFFGGMDEEMMADEGSSNPQDGSGKSTLKNSGGKSIAVPIYKGIAQKPNTFTLHYKKAYHFFLNATLPQYTHDKSEYIRFIPGGCHDIPWNYLFCYVSPREAILLRTQFTEVRATYAKCTLTSLGVRLPFVTNQSTTTVANANAQYPICDYGELDKHYYTETKFENLDNLMAKMQGSDLYDLPVTDDREHKEFENISAQAASRQFDNPLHILYPNPMRKVKKQKPNPVNPNVPILEEKEESSLQQHHGEPQIYQFCTLVNGSNYLGPLFTKEYKPKNGLLFSRNTMMVRTQEPLKKPAAMTLLNVAQRLSIQEYEQVGAEYEAID
ncbi:hypothetical protein O3M35_000782 [Rhynocoris fuscipes]|uniref:Uncharacterized protein n=1 Tax=Rhynocoris fuscipes TaxID=488301 RepID=A0AAW1DTB2_9HEMI